MKDGIFYFGYNGLVTVGYRTLIMYHQLTENKKDNDFKYMLAHFLTKNEQTLCPKKELVKAEPYFHPFCTIHKTIQNINNTQKRSKKLHSNIFVLISSQYSHITL